MVNLRNTFVGYRWIIYFVILVLAFLAVRNIIVFCKTRPPDHVRVHDLTWPDRTDKDNVVYRRWRYFLKPRSYLPFKIEKYFRSDPNEDYILEETLVISYPSTGEIRKDIKL